MATANENTMVVAMAEEERTPTSLLSISNEELGMIIEALDYDQFSSVSLSHRPHKKIISNLRLVRKILADLGARNLFKEVCDDESL